MFLGKFLLHSFSKHFLEVRQHVICMRYSVVKYTLYGGNYFFFLLTYACTGLIILSLVNYVRNVVLNFGFLWQ